MDDQAIEEDSNTHLIVGYPQGQVATNKDLMLQGGDDESDDDWEEQFNKFYESPLDKLEELKYLGEVMARMGHIYGAYMDKDKQEQLSLYL